jgi:hypothetical protein
MNSSSNLLEQTDRDYVKQRVSDQKVLIAANTAKEKLGRVIKRGLDRTLDAFVNGGPPAGCWPVPW